MDRFVCLKKSEIVIPEEGESSDDDEDDEDSDEDGDDSADDDENETEIEDDVDKVVPVASPDDTSLVQVAEVKNVCKSRILVGPSVDVSLYLGSSWPGYGPFGCLNPSPSGRCSKYAIARRDPCNILCSNSCAMLPTCFFLAAI